MTINQLTRGFETTEFFNRTLKAQAIIAKRGLAGLLFMSESEVRYFTGFHTLFWQSPTRPWFVFIPATGKPIAIIPEIGAALMRKTWVDDIRTWGAPAPKDDGISLLTDLFRPLSKGAKIGLMKGHETSLRMPLADWQKLVAALPNCSFVDVASEIQRLRMVKSIAEIEKLKHICAIASDSFAKVPEFAQAGQPLAQVFREFKRTALQIGADDTPYLVGGAALGGYMDVISPPSLTPLKIGDILMLDTGLTWDGYFCDFDRNWAIGKANEQSKLAYKTLWRATEAGLEAARPGNTCRDIFIAMSAVISEMDRSDGDIGRLGHGLGTQLTEQPSLAAFDTTELVENMVLTLEPSLTYGDGQMMVHEENILIGPDGATLLSRRAARDLPVI